MTTIDQLPSPPQPTDSPTTFSSKAFAWVAALVSFVTQTNAVAGEVNAAAAAAATAKTGAESAATAANASATSASASANAASQAAATAVNAPGTQATSTSSLTVGSGSKSLTLAQTGKAFGVGMYVLVAQTSAPTTNWMVGAVTAFVSGTGAMTITVSDFAGSATATDWTVSPATPAGANVVTPAGAQTLTNKTLTAPVTSNEKLTTARETTTISATAAAGAINYDALTQSVLYYTTNASANFTINVRGNSSTTLNSMMAVGESLTVVFMNTNGATAYYASAFQIDGNAVTPKWQGGTAPTAGNASAIDAYSLTIVKTASATFAVLASQTKFA